MIGQTQTEFAALIGVSKDAVASWDIERNAVSGTMARRIALVTGVDAEDLRRGRQPLHTGFRLGGRAPFSAETFQEHRSSYWGRWDEAAGRQHLKHCVDALGLLFLAAAKPGKGKTLCRLPGVLDSFLQWCEQTRADFQLKPQIEEQLAERKFTLALNHSYGQWRKLQKDDPAMCRMMGFKDDPRKGDEEYLRLEMETIPHWRPGHPMRGKSGNQ